MKKQIEQEFQSDNEFEIIFQVNRLKPASKYNDPKWWVKESAKSMRNIHKKYGKYIVKSPVSS